MVPIPTYPSPTTTYTLILLDGAMRFRNIRRGRKWFVIVYRTNACLRRAFEQFPASIARLARLVPVADAVVAHT